MPLLVESWFQSGPESFGKQLYITNWMLLVYSSRTYWVLLFLIEISFCGSFIHDLWTILILDMWPYSFYVRELTGVRDFTYFTDFTGTECYINLNGFRSPCEVMRPPRSLSHISSITLKLRPQYACLILNWMNMVHLSLSNAFQYSTPSSCSMQSTFMISWVGYLSSPAEVLWCLS